MTRQRFLEKVNSPIQMWFFMWLKLPAARFMGVSVVKCDENQCTTSLPYRWRSQNPFKSTYFAAQCAAAEMSTGLLAMAHLQEKPRISMLVTHIEAEFLKKASDTLHFTCTDGRKFEEVIAQVLSTGEAQVFTAESIGRLPDGTIASKMKITWSFKRSQKAS